MGSINIIIILFTQSLITFSDNGTILPRQCDDVFPAAQVISDRSA
jgi:hypothetical protein